MSRTPREWALSRLIEAVYGDAWIQPCVVHLIRNSLKHVSYKDRKTVARDLKPIYQAATEETAAAALEGFDEMWGDKYPMIAESWRARWELFIPFLAFPEPIRRIMYTTDEIVKGLLTPLAEVPQGCSSKFLTLGRV